MAIAEKRMSTKSSAFSRGLTRRSNVAMRSSNEVWRRLKRSEPPLGILLANLGGAFLLGLFATWIDGVIRHHVFRPFWEAGFVRSFTTLSTFSLQSIVLIEAGAWGTFIPYVAISVVGGLILIWCGERLGAFFVARGGGSVDVDERTRVEEEL